VVITPQMGVYIPDPRGHEVFEIAFPDLTVKGLVVETHEQYPSA